MPLPKVVPQGDPNIQIVAQSIEQISVASEATLNERLEAIFADSPWVVTAELEGNGSYTYYFKNKTGDPRPVILLTSNKPPLLLKSGSAEQDILLIPLPDNSWTKADYDEKNRQISFEDHSEAGACEFPGYMAVGLKDTVGDQMIGMTPYSAPGVGLRAQYGGRFYLPVSPLIDVRCFEVVKETKKRVDTDVDPKTSAFMLNGVLLFDMSGSVNPSLYFKLFRERIARDIFDFARITENVYIGQKCGSGRSRERDCEEKIYKEFLEKGQQALLGTIYYLGDEAKLFNMPFDMCKVTGCGRIHNYKDALKAAQPTVDALVSAVEKKIKAIVPSGPDLPGEIRQEYTLETTFFQAPYGQNIAGRLFREVCASAKDTDAECLPAADRKKAVEWSLQNGLPLFLSISLVQDENSVIPAAVSGDLMGSPLTAAGMTGITASDRELETAIRETFPLPPAERDDKTYEMLAGLCRDKGRDRSVSGASASLLGAWALKGDTKARHVLTELFNDSLSLASEEARTVVARTLALLMNDEEAKVILNRIKATPDAEMNSMLLSALAGREEFLEGFKVLLDSHHPASYMTGRAASLAEAMGRVFIDPILQTDDLELNLTPDELRSLSGNNWPNDLLQRVHERLVLSRETSTDEVASALYPLIKVLRNYATSSIVREMVEKSELDVNTDLTKRHIYPGLGRADIIRRGVQLARTVGREEAYLSIEPNGTDEPVVPTAIEVGVLETEGSVGTPQLTRSEFERFLKTTKVKDDGEFRVVHWHIHPLGLTNRHMLTDNIPSDADLFSYFYFTKDWLKKTPNAKFEFRILTPYGVLLLNPKEAFVDLIKNYPQEYVRFVAQYQNALNDSGGQITAKRLKILLDEYFDVEFKIIEGR